VVEFAKCPRCKRPILDGAKRCPGCGTPVGGAVVSGTRARRGRWGTPLTALAVGLVSIAVYLSGWKPAPRTAPPPQAPAPVTTSESEDSRFGLSEDKRRAVYQEMLRAEDHAQVEAEHRYPPPGPGAPTDRWQRAAETREQFRNQAEEEDKNAIAKHYGLTAEQLKAIGKEGFERNWPRPARRSIR
jgi:hypothetical protein